MTTSSLPIYFWAKRALPPVPSREQVCGINLYFQGLVVNTKQFGALPWFGASLAWLNTEDRLSSYIAQRAAGDTHAIIALPCGYPLYDEPNQPYNRDNFPALDWSNNSTQLTPEFINLVTEVIENGLIPTIFCDERYELSVKQIALIQQALKDAGLVKYCITIPGWDGVFYGWTPEQVMNWAAIARSINPDCYLGLEHNSGHIPLGEGGSDYLPGGKMRDFDVVLSEYASSIPHDTTVWQIVARMVNPYIKPADDPDTGTAPFYLVGSERGPRYYCAFEFGGPTGEYNWVRVDMNNYQTLQQMIETERQYLRGCGCKYTG